MAIRLNHLPPSSKLLEVAKRLDVDGSGQLTKAELEKARAEIDAGLSTFTPAEKGLVTKLEKILVGEEPLPAPSARPAARGHSPLGVRLGGDAVIDASGNLARLNDTQRAVLADVKVKAKERSDNARAALLALAQRNGYSEADVDRALEYIRTEAPITINFHPDKALRQQTSRYGAASADLPKYEVAVDRETSKLIDAFMVDGHYKNQFETGITSGSASAYPGGSRDVWEKTIFEGGYHGHDLIPAERPKYGAMNAAKYPKGPAGSYGSCYFVLKPGARERTTFTAGNSSVRRAEHVGTVDHFQHVLKDASMFKDIMEVALGRREFTTTTSGWGYIEAQVHGPVSFDKDIAAVVIDAKFAGTEYEDKLRKFAEMHKIEVQWTNGQTVMSDDEWKASRAGT